MKTEHAKFVKEKKIVSKELKLINTSLKLSRTLKSNKELKDNIEKVFNYFPKLNERKSQLAATLSGGELQMLCIGRGLMSNPKMIMLDEPSAALAPQIVLDIFKNINRIRKDGLTVLIVEQNVRMALLLADYGYVIKDGVINVEGDSKKRKAAWSAAAHIGGKDISLWTSAYPSGFQPYRNSHFNYDEWEAAGYDRAFVEDYLGSNLDTYNHPNSLNEPRIPGIFQYYSVAEDELAKGYAGQYGSAQETADAIAVAWEKITDQIGRESQIKLYKAALGL